MSYAHLYNDNYAVQSGVTITYMNGIAAAIAIQDMRVIIIHRSCDIMNYSLHMSRVDATT